jgi:hypothetical protein
MANLIPVAGRNLPPPGYIPPQDPNQGPTDYGSQYGAAPSTGLMAGSQVAYQNVNAPQETVGGQLTTLLAGDSPYIQQARNQAAATAAGRGLLNSSIAAGAGQNAAISAALPIAQGNAQEYANVGQANQAASNQQLGIQTGANAQIQSASISAGGQMGAAAIYADATKQGQQLQYQIAGQQLGYNYAQLAQQGTQFNTQLAQQNQQFGATLNNQQSEFTQTQSLQIGQYQANQMWNQYALGMTLQQNSQNNYGQAYAAMLANPNLTPDQRSSYATTLNQFYTGMSQQNAALPAFVPPWVNDPSYWTSNWTGG